MNTLNDKTCQTETAQPLLLGGLLCNYNCLQLGLLLNE